MPDPPPVELDRVGLGVDPEHAQARRAEVARVVADLEAHVVGAEDAPQHLLALGKQPVHLRRRERDVEEEADREPRRPRRSIAGTSMRWKSCTHTRESGSQFARIVSAKRSFTST